MQHKVSRSSRRDPIQQTDFLHDASEIKPFRDSVVAARVTMDIVAASYILLRKTTAPTDEISSDGEGNIESTSKQHDDESDRKEWREVSEGLLTAYIGTEDADQKAKKIKYLENFEAMPVKFRDVLAQEIWRTVNSPKAKKKNWKPHQGAGKKPSQEDINSLKNLYAKCYASVAQELGKVHLRQALESAEQSWAIKIENKYFIEFSINIPAIEEIIEKNKTPGYNKIVQLVRCLLIYDVQKAQDLWDAVRSRAHDTNPAFRAAKEALNTHLEECIAKNSPWRDNPVLKRNFNAGWEKFELDATKKLL
ncbi:hypothetical protein [Rhizobacter sp. SG703]|uniref:hypothetical protein n=1 Tax=Rhizobacter sp. SG703 TaxID=2587140 RepID=UPI0014456419|nr:hypothetical protein [Rhizobacter sp. SG703]NKI95349.1 hypothetical protein [Rhizobacter sp. SG703]